MKRLIVFLVLALIPWPAEAKSYQYQAGGYHEATAIWTAVWVDTSLPALKPSMSHQNISVAFVQEGDNRVVLELAVVRATGEAENYKPQFIGLYWQQNGQYQTFYWPGQLVNGWNTISLHKATKGYDVRVNGGWWYQGYPVQFTETPRATWFAEGYGIKPPAWPHVVYLEQDGWRETARVLE